MRIFKCLIIGVLLIALSACNGQVEKINGVSFVASGGSIDQTNVQPVVNVNANYAAIMPFGFMRSLDHAEIIHNTERQWFGETRAGAKQYIDELRKKQIKIMVKPQIWVRRGESTGLIEMADETNWKLLEKSYTSFIIEYAELAEEVRKKMRSCCICSSFQTHA